MATPLDCEELLKYHSNPQMLLVKGISLSVKCVSCRQYMLYCFVFNKFKTSLRFLISPIPCTFIEAKVTVPDITCNLLLTLCLWFYGRCKRMSNRKLEPDLDPHSEKNSDEKLCEHGAWPDTIGVNIQQLKVKLLVGTV